MTQIEKDFFTLTKYTCPHGFERDMYDDMLTRDYGAEWVEGIGYALRVGKPNGVLFTSHMDTAGREKLPSKVTRRSLAGSLVGTDGKTILGADDKAGMAVMLHMIREGTQGAYMFYVGEEVGMVGSQKHADLLKAVPYDVVVSFDRAGHEDIITHQSTQRTASDTFATALAGELGKLGLDYAPSSGGSWTDSYAHSAHAKECTNLSVGYSGQHTHSETQDLRHLVKIAKAAAKIDWGNLPTPGHEGEFLHGTWDDKYGTGSWYPDSYYQTINSADDLLYDNAYYDYDELLAFVMKSPEDAAYALEHLLYRGTYGKTTTEWEG